MRTKRRQQRKKIPWNVTCALPFLSHEPWSQGWQEAVRQLVWETRPAKGTALMDLYDENVGGIIQEVVGSN